MGEWYVQLPAAAAVVTVVILFLKHLRAEASDRRAESVEMRGQFVKVSDDCHAHSDQQQTVYTENIQMMATTFEKTIDKLANGKDK